MSDRSTEEAREWYVEIPTEFLPKGVTQAGCDLALLRSWAEIHRDHEFDHKMEVGASSILFLIDAWDRLRAVLKERDEQKRRGDIFRDEVKANTEAMLLAASKMRELRADLLRAEEALQDGATKIEKAIADNKQGPEVGWTHPDEAADELRRRVGFIADDLRAALSPKGQPDE